MSPRQIPENLPFSETKLTLPALDHTYHFFSGMGRGTAFTRQGKFGWPDRFLPKIVPTRFSGRMTKKQMQQTATYRKGKQKLLIISWVVCVYSQHRVCFQIPHHLSQLSLDCVPRMFYHQLVVTLLRSVRSLDSQICFVHAHNTNAHKIREINADRLMVIITWCLGLTRTQLKMPQIFSSSVKKKKNHRFGWYSQNMALSWFDFKTLTWSTVKDGSECTLQEESFMFISETWDNLCWCTRELPCLSVVVNIHASSRWQHEHVSFNRYIDDTQLYISVESSNVDALRFLTAWIITF